MESKLVSKCLHNTGHGSWELLTCIYKTCHGTLVRVKSSAMEEPRNSFLYAAESEFFDNNRNQWTRLLDSTDYESSLTCAGAGSYEGLRQAKNNECMEKIEMLFPGL